MYMYMHKIFYIAFITLYVLCLLIALSCKGLRQSQAYLGIMEILELYKYDVTVQTGGLLALSQVLQDGKRDRRLGERDICKINWKRRDWDK